MDQSPAIKIAFALAVLVTLWIAVYWLWEPSRSSSPSISFAPAPAKEPAASIVSESQGAAPTPTRASDRPDLGAGPDPGVVENTDEPRPRGTGLDGLPSKGAGVGEHPAREGGVLVVRPPKFEEYRVQTGETFETIAAKRYGSRSMSAAIARANPFVDPRRLRAGRVILLPVDPTNIQGRVEPSARSAAEGWKTHTVRSGETLSGISRTHYGTTALSRHIFEANSDRLKSENQLKVGMELLIPPRPSQPGPSPSSASGGGDSPR